MNGILVHLLGRELADGLRLEQKEMDRFGLDNVRRRKTI
jgi:hypothetical protein